MKAKNPGNKHGMEFNINIGARSSKAGWVGARHHVRRSPLDCQVVVRHDQSNQGRSQSDQKRIVTAAPPGAHLDLLHVVLLGHIAY
eukprot:scaffold304790_cov17-Tisochrysis_lutea.AAC.1